MSSVAGLEGKEPLYCEELFFFWGVSPSGGSWAGEVQVRLKAFELQSENVPTHNLTPFSSCSLRQRATFNAIKDQVVTDFETEVDDDE